MVAWDPFKTLKAWLEGLKLCVGFGILQERAWTAFSRSGMGLACSFFWNLKKPFVCLNGVNFAWKKKDPIGFADLQPFSLKLPGCELSRRARNSGRRDVHGGFWYETRQLKVARHAGHTSATWPKSQKISEQFDERLEATTIHLSTTLVPGRMIFLWCFQIVSGSGCML